MIYIKEDIQKKLSDIKDELKAIIKSINLK